MKKILLRSTLFLLIISASAYAVLYAIAPSFSDRFYHKFKTPSGSLVLGSSRALLGIDPEQVCHANLPVNSMLNYAFTLRNSPYGKVYHDAVMHKIPSGAQGQLYILEVSPVAVSQDKKKKTDEDDMILGKMFFFNQNPNLEYLVRNSEVPLYCFLLNSPPKKQTQVPHVSGWLENKVSPDSLQLLRKCKTQSEEYDSIFRVNTISSYRMQWLEKTVQDLSVHGQVILVRMPVTAEMKKKEDRYCPQFDAMIGELANRNKAGYIDLSAPKDYRFDDLHHMNSVSAARFSRALGDTLIGLVH